MRPLVVVLLEGAHRQGVPRPIGDPGRRCAGCRHRRQARHLVFEGGGSDVQPIGTGTTTPWGVHHQLHLASGDQLDRVDACTGTHFGNHVGHLDARLFQCRSGSRCGDHLEAECHEALCHVDPGRLVPVGEGEEDRARGRQPAPRCDLALGERQPERRIDAHHLARRPHLRPEDGVHPREPVEGQDGLLHRDVLRRRRLRQQPLGPELGQCGTHHHPGCHHRHRHPRGLRHERHRPAGPRVRLQHVDLFVLDGELHVAEALDLKSGCDRPHDLLELVHHRWSKGLRRQGASGVAGMDPGFLHVLHHAADQDLAVRITDGVDIDLHRILEEPVHEDRTVGRHPSLSMQRSGHGIHGLDQPVVVVDDLHRPAAQNIGGAHEHRIANAPGDLEGLGSGHGRTARRLCDAELAAQLVPTLPVFGKVDRRRGRAQYEIGLQIRRKLERRLAAEAHDHADQLRIPPRRSAFGGDDGGQVLRGQRLEVEAVGRVVVGRDRLRVAVDHDRLVPRLPQCDGGMDAAVVEFDALTDPVRPRAQDDHPGARRRRHLVLVLVGAVVVRGVGLELGSARVDGLERRLHAVLTAGGSDPRFGDVRLAGTEHMGDLGVHEAEAPEPAPRAPVDLLRPDAEVRLELERHPGIGHLGDLGHEPGIDARLRADLLDLGTASQERLDTEDPIGRGPTDLVEQLVDGHVVERSLARIRVQPEAPLLEGADRLLQRLGERPADPHDLADGLHPRAELGKRARQLLESPAGDLRDHIVDHRLERRGRGARDVVDDLIQPVADGEPRRDLRDGEPRRLRREGGRSRHTRVHLDHQLPARPRIHGELDIGAARLDAHAPDARERRVPHLLVLDIGQRLRRRHRDRVPGVDPHRIDVLDRADDHAIVRVVSHDLELEFLPTGDRLLDEDLGDGAGGQSLARQPDQRLPVRRDARAGPAEDEARPDHDRIADGVGDGEGFVQRVSEARTGHLEADLLHRVLEALPVLRGLDRLRVRTDHLDTGRFEDAGPGELHGQVERRLPTQCRQERVRAFPLDDRAHDVHGQRLDVRPVRHGRIGHDRGRVRVHQDDPEAFFGQHPARLGSRVVELARLADDDRTGPDDEDRFDVGSAGHQPRPFRDRGPTRSISSRNSSNK